MNAWFCPGLTIYGGATMTTWTDGAGQRYFAACAGAADAIFGFRVFRLVDPASGRCEVVNIGAVPIGRGSINSDGTWTASGANGAAYYGSIPGWIPRAAGSAAPVPAPAPAPAPTVLIDEEARAIARAAQTAATEAGRKASKAQSAADAARQAIPSANAIMDMARAVFAGILDEYERSPATSRLKRNVWQAIKDAFYLKATGREL